MSRRILHLITGLDVGGAEEMLLRMVPKLNETRLENRVMCIKGRGLVGKELEEKGSTVYYLDFNRLVDAPKSLRAFSKIVKEWKPEILVTHLVHADMVGRLWGSLILGIPKAIVYRHGSHLKWGWWSRLDQWTQKYVAQYCVVSKWLEKELLEKGFEQSKIKFLPNAVDIMHFQNVSLDTQKKYRAKLNWSEDTTILGVISAIKPGKGYEELIEAMSSLKNKDQVKLLIIGEGPDRTAIEKEVERRGLASAVKFLGLQRDIAEWLSIMDLFISPTHFEGMSVALLQAMAAGKAIITTDIEANKGLVKHEESALLVPVKNSLALAKAIEDLIENPGKRKKLGEKAAEQCQKTFNLSKTVEDFANLLKTI